MAEEERYFLPGNEVQYFDFQDKVNAEQSDIGYESGTEVRSTFIDVVGGSSDEFSDVFDNKSLKEELNVDSIIPDGLLSSTNKLRTFLKEYYRFLQTRSDTGSYIINNSLLTSRDVDGLVAKNDSTNLDKLFFEFALKEFSNNETDLFFDKRSFLKNAVDFFSHKGTEDGFRNILKVLLNDFSTRFYEPWNQVIHTSQGDWTQERYITVRLDKVFSADTVDGIDGIDFIINSNKLKTFAIYQEPDGARYNRFSYIEVTRSQRVDDETLRLFTRQEITNEIIQQDQRIIGLDDTAETVFFEAIITNESLESVEIVEPGMGWRVGQIIVFPGSKRDTVLKVTKTKSRSTRIDEIANVQIIDPGFHHSISSLSVSPYYLKPALSETFIDTKQQEEEPFGIDYRIVVRDNTDQTTEIIYGRANGTYFYNVYDLTDGESPYTASTLFEKEIIFQNTESPLETSVSFEDWQNSVATLELQYGPIGVLPGYWKTDRSTLSNHDSKTQDNFFYQIFSYVISSNENPDDYKNYAFLFHPAGLKRFMEHRDSHHFGVGPVFVQEEMMVNYNQLNLLCWDDGTYDSDQFDSCTGAFPNVCWDGEDYDEEEYDFGFCANAFGNLFWDDGTYDSEEYSPK